jgi:fatty acid desaturase
VEEAKRMGRRSRARDRAEEPTARVPATPGGLGSSPGWGLLHRLNPIKSAPGRARVRNAAAAFAVAAALLGILGWATGLSGFFNPAALLAILALVWGLYWLTMRDEEPADEQADEQGGEDRSS